MLSSDDGCETSLHEQLRHVANGELCAEGSDARPRGSMPVSQDVIRLVRLQWVQMCG
jgi:hypothetical protein